jgi:hypothetical protein
VLPVVSDDPNGPAALPTPHAYQWFTETGRTRAPAWHNEVTPLELLPDSHFEAHVGAGFEQASGAVRCWFTRTS